MTCVEGANVLQLAHKHVKMRGGWSNVESQGTKEPSALRDGVIRVDLMEE